MGKSISIEPITRIEGHMKVETEVTDGRISDVKIMGQMYRGFETFLLNRHPLDAARIAQRVCGVCHEVHGMASVLALEELYKIEPAKNGELLREMILGLHLVSDHFLHFYTLSVPDYVDFTKILEYKGNDVSINNLKDWVIKTKPQFVLKKNKGKFIEDTALSLRIINNYFKALQIRSQCASGMAILGAKVPFIHAALPGGLTTDITPEKLMNYKKALDEATHFAINEYIPDVMAVSGEFKDYFDIGVSYNNFYSNETFKQKGTPLFNGGVIIDGKKQNFDFTNVGEKLDNSFYNNAGKPSPQKEGAYSWTKSPRYTDAPLEVGPLARLAVLEDKGFEKALAGFGVNGIKSSTMARHLARAYESKRICAHMYELLDMYKFGQSTINQFDLDQPVSGKGVGFSLAARGALIHEIEASNGKITRYNMIVPSTWNFGPRDGGQLGVVEKSIIGTKVEYDEKNSIEVGRIVRSYDPCTACSVH